MKYKLGILGGMGPLATCKLFEKIVTKTYATKDQDHIEMVIINKCSIPDRTAAIFENGENPVPKINEGIDELIKNGCENFIIPCNTAHYFKNSFDLQGKINFIDMIEETVKYLENNYKHSKICVLATDGTVKTNIYGKNNNLNINYPNETIQKQVMEIIYKTKSGFDMCSELNKIIDNKEYDLYLLACTELSIYNERLNGNTLDTMDVLVSSAIRKCGKKIINKGVPNETK
ncbi:aspartate racemase [Coprobacillus sp. CAG:698]|nr:aspartate racemase [Coprobacillus sp. CAG:698]